jgi:hypothetical protein
MPPWWIRHRDEGVGSGSSTRGRAAVGETAVARDLAALAAAGLIEFDTRPGSVWCVSLSAGGAGPVAPVAAGR